jgi:hypothetical protein
MSCSHCGATHERARFCKHCGKRWPLPIPVGRAVSRPGPSRPGTTSRSVAQREIVAFNEAAASSLAGIQRMYDRAMARAGVHAQAPLQRYLAVLAATS